MTPNKIATLDDNIVEICKTHKAENWHKVSYCACVFVQPLWLVKFYLWSRTYSFIQVSSLLLYWLGVKSLGYGFPDYEELLVWF